MEITLNGQPVTINQPTLSYEDIVALAGVTGTPSIAVSYGRPGGQLLEPGGVVQVQSGMDVGCVEASQ